MLKAVWTIANIQASASLARWRAEFDYQDAQAIWSLKTQAGIKRLEDATNAVDSATFSMSISKVDSVGFADNHVIQQTKTVSDPATLQDSSVFTIEKVLSDEILMLDASNVVSATTRLQNDGFSMNDICLTFLSAGLGGSKFNEAELNGFTFNE